MRRPARVYIVPPVHNRGIVWILRTTLDPDSGAGFSCRISLSGPSSPQAEFTLTAPPGRGMFTALCRVSSASWGIGTITPIDASAHRGGWPAATHGNPTSARTHPPQLDLSRPRGRGCSARAADEE